MGQDNLSIGGKISSYVLGVLSGKRKFHVFLAGLLLGLISSIQPSYGLYKDGLPYINSLEQKITTAMSEVFPEKLEVKINNGSATTNVTEPYFLTISQATVDELLQAQHLQFQGESAPKPQSKLRLLTLDTQGKIEDFEMYQSLGMLTAKNLVYYDQGKVVIRSLGTVPNMVISKQIVLDKVQEINANNKTVLLLKTGIVLSPVFMALFYAVYFVIEIFGGAFIAWIVGRLLKINVKFAALYGFVGFLYAVPAFILILIKFIPRFELFYSWIYSLLDMLLIATIYVVLANDRASLENGQNGQNS